MHFSKKQLLLGPEDANLSPSLFDNDGLAPRGREHASASAMKSRVPAMVLWGLALRALIRGTSLSRTSGTGRAAGTMRMRQSGQHRWLLVNMYTLAPGLRVLAPIPPSHTPMAICAHD